MVRQQPLRDNRNWSLWARLIAGADTVDLPLFLRRSSVIRTPTAKHRNQLGPAASPPTPQRTGPGTREVGGG